MSESLRNDGRIWVPKTARPTSATRARSPRRTATTTWSGCIPAFGNLVPRDIASRAAKNVVRRGPRRRARAVSGVYLDFADAIRRLGREAIAAKYGNLFDMYAQITGEDPYADADADLSGGALHDGRALGRLRPAVHDPGPLRHRRGQLLRPRRATGSALSALMQGLADGCFVLAEHDPATISPAARSDGRPQTTRPWSRP